MSSRRVALVKSAGRADAFAVALRDAGCVPVLVSPYQREPVERGERALDDALAIAQGLAAGTGRGVWVAVSSSHAVPALEPRRTALAGARIAAVGGGTATALHAAGIAAEVVGDGGGGVLARRMLAAGLAPGDTVLHPCAEEVRPELANVLAAAGVDVNPIPVYRMAPDPVGARAAAEGGFHAVVVTSPRLASRAAELFPDRPPAVAIGRTTAAALRDLGWAPVAVAASPSPGDVAAAVINVT